WWGNQVGFLAGIIYLSSPYPVIGANIVSTDSLLTAWIALQFLCYALAVQHAQTGKRARWLVILSWLFFGLAFLTKSTAALVPFPAILLWHWRVRPPLRLLDPLGIVLGGFIGLGWYVHELLEPEHQEMLSLLYHEQVAGRLWSDQYHRNSGLKGVFLVYLPIMLFGTGIWSFALFRRLRHSGISGLKLLLRTDQTLTLLCLWIIVPLAVFTVSKSKLFLYLLPLFPAVALLTAYMLFVTADEQDRQRFGHFIGLGCASVYTLLLLKGSAAFFPTNKNMRDFYAETRSFVGQPESTHFTLVGDRELLGLQFYFQRQFDDVPLERLEEKVAALSNSSSHGQSDILLARDKDAETVRLALQSHDRGFKEMAVNGYTMFRVSHF
ncbi:MAG: glycosyltransferase family 39 protein, partial [Bdellovibrionales bacterium]|nr:glycosyltransferase family 39 protein [Bdellovibrionales bacterium]